MSDYAHGSATDQAFASLSPRDAEAVRKRDNKRLELEKSRVAPHVAARMTTPTHSLFRMMKEWEWLIEAMETEWRVEPQPLLDDYLFVLETRAELECGLCELSPSPPESIVQALDQLDKRFLQCTTQEGQTGAGGLAKWLDPVEKRPPMWLWNRRPRVIPWGVEGG